MQLCKIKCAPPIKEPLTQEQVESKKGDAGSQALRRVHRSGPKAILFNRHHLFHGFLVFFFPLFAKQAKAMIAFKEN